MPPGTRATASFAKLVNDYFDIFNTNKPIYDSRPTRQAFGFKKSLAAQTTILVKIFNNMKEMRATGKATKLPFQKGIMQSIMA